MDCIKLVGLHAYIKARGRDCRQSCGYRRWQSISLHGWSGFRLSRASDSHGHV